MPHLADFIKDTRPVRDGASKGFDAPYANPDRLVLPAGMRNPFSEAGNADKLSTPEGLTDYQQAQIERAINLKIPRSDRFVGERGDSLALPDVSSPKGAEAKALLDNLGLKGIEFKNGYPIFSKVAVESVNISKMTADRECNYKQAYSALADRWNAAAKDGRTDWKPTDVEAWKNANDLRPHEREDLKTVEFVPGPVHEHYPHVGGRCIAEVMGVFSDRQMAEGNVNRGDFYDQFDA